MTLAPPLLPLPGKAMRVFADSATLSHRTAFLRILSKFSLEISVFFVADQILDDAGKDERFDEFHFIKV